MAERLLKVGEVAERLSVSENTIWRWTADGRLAPPIRRGTRYTRFKESDINAFIEAERPVSAKPAQPLAVRPPWETAA